MEDELLAEGIVHRCFCAYHSNHFGDSPKGIVDSPFYPMSDWDFSGTARLIAPYIFPWNGWSRKGLKNVPRVLPHLARNFGVAIFTEKRSWDYSNLRDGA